MADNPINTTRKRRALKPRKEPYWFNFKRGMAIGLCVGATKREWCARSRDPIGGAKYKYATFGSEDELSYEDAEAAARAFADQVAQVERPDYTVRDAIADYVRDTRLRNGEKSATDAEQRLTVSVPAALANKRLTDLRTIDINRWRDSLVRTDGDEEDVRRSKSGVNRTLAILKGALNLAFRSGICPSDAQWRRVQAFRDVDAARTLFLDPEQVKALLAVAETAFRHLLQAAVLTGARYGELADAVVADFDAKGGTLHLDGKTGPRTCYLSGDGIAFFKRVAKGKLPGAPLLPRDDGAPWGKSHQKRPMDAAVQAAKLPAETVFYSLRHYHISRALLAGVPAQVIAENCGTSVRMIEKHYGKFTKAARRTMLDQVAL
jgi:integrase